MRARNASADWLICYLPTLSAITYQPMSLFIFKLSRLQYFKWRGGLLSEIIRCPRWGGEAFLPEWGSSDGLAVCRRSSDGFDPAEKQSALRRALIPCRIASAESPWQLRSNFWPQRRGPAGGFPGSLVPFRWGWAASWSRHWWSGLRWCPPWGWPNSLGTYDALLDRHLAQHSYIIIP